MVSNQIKKIEITIVPGWLFWILIVFVLGYFQYGQTINGGLAVVLIAIGVTALAIVGLMPILGLVAYFIIGTTWLMPNVLAFTGISNSWLIQLIFWCGFILAFILTFVMTVLLLAKK